MVIDHDHAWMMRGRWRGPRCAVCGERVASHLSWGRELAAKLGGDPLDYVEGAPRARRAGS